MTSDARPDYRATHVVDMRAGHSIPMPQILGCMILGAQEEVNPPVVSLVE